MPEYKYKYTIFTACFNASGFIDRVFKTLDSQTYRNFEWIVINDASTDNTSEIIQDYIKHVDFKVKFFDLKHNQMLAANYNLAVENAEGELFFLHDHDDEFIPTVLEDYLKLYNEYNAENVGGLVGRCQTQFGKITPRPFTKRLMSFWEYGLDEKGNYTGEAPRVIKTDVLKKYMPFDPEEKLNPPIEEFMACDGYKFITTNEIVRKYYYANSENSLTFSMSKYRLHFWRRQLLYINKFQFYMPWPFKRKIKACLEYDYASVKLGKTFKEAVSAVQYEKAYVVLLYPLAKMIGWVADNKKLHDTIIRLMNGNISPKKQVD